MDNKIPIVIHHDLSFPIGSISLDCSSGRALYALLKHNALEMSCMINSADQKIVAISLILKQANSITENKKEHKLSRLQVLGISEEGV